MEIKTLLEDEQLAQYTQIKLLNSKTILWLINTNKNILMKGLSLSQESNSRTYYKVQLKLMSNYWNSHTGVSLQTKKLNACHVQHTMEIKTLLEDEQLAQHTQETTRLLIL